MKPIRFALAAVVSALAVAACQAHGSPRDTGPTVDRDYQVGAFQRIAVAGPYEVIVRAGGQPGVHARGGAAVLDETEILVKDGTLQVRPKDRHGNFSWNWGRDDKIVVEVNGAGALQAAAIAGSGGIRIDTVSSPRFKGEVAGSGDLNVDRLDSADVSLAIAGSGDMRAAGRAQKLEVSIAGSGDADLSGLESAAANLSIAGSGNVRARATRTADVSIMGSGDVELTGGARCSVNKRGSGNVSCS